MSDCGGPFLQETPPWRKTQVLISLLLPIDHQINALSHLINGLSYLSRSLINL